MHRELDAADATDWTRTLAPVGAFALGLVVVLVSTVVPPDVAGGEPVGLTFAAVQIVFALPVVLLGVGLAWATRRWMEAGPVATWMARLLRATAWAGAVVPPAGFLALVLIDLFG